MREQSPRSGAKAVTREEEIEAAWALHREAVYGPLDCRTPEALARLAEAQNWRCCYCHCEMLQPSRDIHPRHARRATFEHVIPLSLGGANEIDNLAVACWLCNQKRGSRMRREHLEVLPVIRRRA